MTDVRPAREKGHLAVAAIRVLHHQQGTPPSPDQIGGLLDWGDEETHVVLHGLVEAGILKLHKTPFDAHYEVGDHLELEDLATADEQEGLQDEVEDFQRRSRSKQEKMEELLRSGGVGKEKSKQMEELEKQFSEFKKEPPRPPI